MRHWIYAIALLGATLASPPAWAHQNDPVRQAERVGHWLQLQPAQVQQLAHLLTDIKLQRRARSQALKPELLAVLDQAQKARLAELMVNRQLRLPPRGGDGEARLQALQQALQLSPAQVAELRSRGERIRSENQHLREQRLQELTAIVGADNAARIEQRLEQRRQRRAQR